jgi:RES domain-containing protein
MTETLAYARYYRLSIGASMPRVFVELEADLKNVIDLRDGNTRQRIRVGKRAMMTEDWHRATDLGHEALTQAIGRVVHEIGLEGLIVPSAQTGSGSNLVIFPANLMSLSHVEVINANKLGR